MRVLDLNTLYINGGEGGVNTYLREKARCLAKLTSPAGESIRHTIVVPGDRTEKSFLGPSTLRKIWSPRLPLNPQHRILVDYSSLASVLREEAPDIVEVDCSYVLAHFAARALRSRGTPVVGFYHAHLPQLYTRPGRSWIRTKISQRTEDLAWGYARYCARPCKRILVSTRDMLSRLEGNAFPPLALVTLGVNLDLFRPRVNGSRPGIPGIDPSRPVVLYVGRLGREKDLDILYAAHRELQAKQGTQLLIAGDGPLRRQAQRFSRSTPGVVWTGMCPYGERLADLYRTADVLAVPGRNETFSLIVLEALASGLPVVAVNQGGPSEICRFGPGRLARAGDAADFAARIREAIADGGSPADLRTHVEARYSWEKTFTRLLEVYEGVIAENRARLEARPLEMTAERETTKTWS